MLHPKRGMQRIRRTKTDVPHLRTCTLEPHSAWSTGLVPGHAQRCRLARPTQSSHCVPFFANARPPGLDKRWQRESRDTLPRFPRHVAPIARHAQLYCHPAGVFGTVGPAGCAAPQLVAWSLVGGALWVPRISEPGRRSNQALGTWLLELVCAAINGQFWEYMHALG